MSATYTVGPTLAPEEAPWPLMWEQDPKVNDGHLHQWESVLLRADGQARRRVEEVIRCEVCHAPRCGSSTEADPCMNRRHHRVDHVAASGERWRIGGSRTGATQ